MMQCDYAAVKLAPDRSILHCLKQRRRRANISSQIKSSIPCWWESREYIL